MSSRPDQASAATTIGNTALSAMSHDSLPVGLVLGGLLLGTYGIFSLHVDGALVAAGFCGTALAYLVDRVWMPSPEDRVNHPGRVQWVESHTEWFAVETVVLFAAGGATVPFLGWSVLLPAVVLAGAVGFHVMPRGAGFKRGGLTKPVAIAGTWAVAGSLLPLLEAQRNLSVGVLLFLVYRFLFVLPNLLLADLADRVGDAEAGLSPWARRWSDRGVRWAATLLLVVGLVGAASWAMVGERPLLVGVDAVGLVLMMGAVWGLDVRRPDYALLADLVVGWPVVTALAAWMML